MVGEASCKSAERARNAGLRTKILAGVLTVAAAIAGCRSFEDQSLEVKTTRSISVELANHPNKLPRGTDVELSCLSPKGWKGEVESGTDKGVETIVLESDRDSLRVLYDPYQAGQHDPPQDPFAALPECS